MNNLKAAFFRKVHYEPHAAQRLFHESDARFRVPLCGRRFGKSQMAAHDYMPTLFKPFTRGWICGPTYDLGEKEFRIFWDKLIVQQKFGQDANVKKAYSVKQGNMYIELPNRSRVEVRSSDHPETLVGEGLDWLIMSEAAKHGDNIWSKYLRPALGDKRGSAVFPTTPEGQNWLYRLWQMGNNPKFPQYESWNFPSWLNTAVFPNGADDPEIIEAKETTDPVEFDQEWGAVPTAFSGKIFIDFDEARHVRTTKFNPALPNYAAIDWGFSNPFAFIEFQVIPSTDTVCVWREYYRQNLTLNSHIEVLKQREQPEGYHLDLVFADAADPEAALEMSTSYVSTMAMPEAKANWREGVDLLASFLKDVETGRERDEFGAPEMAPRFFVDHSCPRFIHEMNNYRRMDAPRTGTDPQDKPKKRDDHGVDAMRYALMHLFKLGARHSLEELVEVNRHLEVTDVVAAMAPVHVGQQALPASDAMLALVGANNDASDTIFNFGEEEYRF